MEKKSKDNDTAAEKVSPMLQQYKDIKEKYDGYILFFRLGDFYEMFYDDAKTVSKELELVLTERAGSPMCGVPFHSAEGYIKRLLDLGYKIAICEQLSDPHASKGLVQRGVIRLITAGTVIEASMLNEDTNNYITAVYCQDDGAGMAFADISTGEVHVFEKRGKNREAEIMSELVRYHPVELLIGSNFVDLKEVCKFIPQRMYNCMCEMIDDDMFTNDPSVIINQFENKDDIKELGLDKMPLVQNALCALFRYVGDAQKMTVKRFTEVKKHSSGEFMDLGLSARRNLELTETMRSKEKRGSLFWVLDKTNTAAGRRKLREWIECPLVTHTPILMRLDAVEELTKNSAMLNDIRDTLGGIFDLERLMSRVLYRKASPADVLSLGKTCERIPVLKKQLTAFRSRLLVDLNEEMCDLSEIATLVSNSINDLTNSEEGMPRNIRDGGVIKEGFNKELDRLRGIADNSRSIIEEMERREKESTGIRTLKIKNNRVFGYYIEVSKGLVENVPDYYERKQTLTNAERYTTEELKKVEADILSASERSLALEAAVFNEICTFIADRLENVSKAANAAASVDVLCSFSQTSLENNYVRPDITLDNVIEIQDGRHPVIEQILTDHPFTPNDVFLNMSDSNLLIITGPNMSGKSTFMRQTAIIVLMAQIGCFVPAKYARLGIVDKIFTRVGASDDLTAGQSTFMVEMNEVAEILSSATRDSLVILDEIGRGTSTFDGISIAKATVEYISEKIGCKTLFATHYHELITMEREYKNIRNFSVAVTKRGDDIKFLHKIVEGGTDDSYGIEVAKLAGLPNKVIARAKEELKELEVSGKVRLAEAIEKSRDDQLSFTAVNEQNVIARLRALDINSFSPIDALMFLKDLKETLE